MRNTLRISSMVFMILIGASVFSLVFRGYGGDDGVHALARNDSRWRVVGAVLAVMLVMFLLGFVLDFIEITFVVVPIVGPVLLAMGLDPVWLGIMIAINLQTSFLTPPFGFALFYLRGVAPESVSTASIYRGAIPFVGIQLLALMLLAAFPELVTWLPGKDLRRLVFWLLLRKPSSTALRTIRLVPARRSTQDLAPRSSASSLSSLLLCRRQTGNTHQSQYKLPPGLLFAVGNDSFAGPKTAGIGRRKIPPLWDLLQTL